MAETTAISWADRTFNPWVGCTKVSPGCDNCYAEGWAKRSGRDVWGAGKTRQHTAPAYWREPLKWNAIAKDTGVRPRVFPSLCDPFDAEAPDEWRKEFWELIDRTPYIDWLLLSKRPNNMPRMLPLAWASSAAKNVWLGTSVESQAQDWRIEKLLEVRATVRFLSLEPLIGRLDLGAFHPFAVMKNRHFVGHINGHIDWVITGGESGPGRRPMELAWAESIQQQCEAVGVAFWFKQIGHQRPGQGEDALGRIYHELPRVTA